MKTKKPQWRQCRGCKLLAHHFHYSSLYRLLHDRCKNKPWQRRWQKNRRCTHGRRRGSSTPALAIGLRAVPGAGFCSGWWGITARAWSKESELWKLPEHPEAAQPASSATLHLLPSPLALLLLPLTLCSLSSYPPSCPICSVPSLTQFTMAESKGAFATPHEAQGPDRSELTDPTYRTPSRLLRYPDWRPEGRPDCL